jgi:hypothetical protein
VRAIQLHNEYAIDLTRRTPMDVTREPGPRLFQVRVDFNLMPLMEAVELAQTELKDTVYGRRLAQSAPAGGLALSYCYTFVGQISLYGSRIEYDRRVTPSDHRRHIPHWPCKIVLDGGAPKLIPHQKVDSSDMQRPTWDRLYVLRPNVLDFIEQLKNKS